MLLTIALVAAVNVTPIPSFQSEEPAVIARFVEHMRDNIDMAVLPDGTRLRRETPAERALPILPPTLAKQVFDRGLLTGEIEACGGDADRMSYEPFMAKLRARRDLDPKQVAFASILLNAAREQRKMPREGGCSDADRAGLAAVLTSFEAAD